ncbi:MAG: uL22 family ribosomal protein [Candidatus Caenarcaniphilales bacterium]|nr:uL22 family ribosomal protein [Candidatus Caenarcaniphilales bacterium]
MTTKQKFSFTPVSKAVVMIKGSADKLGWALDQVRGKSLPEAMNFLFFHNLACCKPVAKLIKSASANALNLQTASDLKDLWISEIYAVKSMELRRFKAGPRGRARPIRKRYSRVFVELGVKK